MLRKKKKTKKKYSARQVKLINRTTLTYRKSVLKIFRDIVDGKEIDHLTKPENIIEEFSKLLDQDINEVHDIYYRRLENLIGGSDAVLKQDDLFSLVEKIVWDNRESEIVGANIEIRLHQFAKSYCIFLGLNGKYQPVPGYFQASENGLKSFEDGYIYKARFGKISNIERLHYFDLVSDKRKKDRDTYFVFKTSGNVKYDFVFSFINESDENVYFGIYLKHYWLMVLISLEEQEYATANFDFDRHLDDLGPKSNLTEDRIGTTGIPFITVYPYLSKRGINRAQLIFEQDYNASPYSIYLDALVDSKEKLSVAEKCAKIIKDMDV